MSARYLYFDVETVPDQLPQDLEEMLLPSEGSVRVPKNIKDPAKIEAKRAELLEKLDEEREDSRSKWSLEPLTARIVCISAALSYQGDKTVEVKSFVDKSEKAVIEGFVNHIWDACQKRVVPVTFNGKSFDMRMVWMKIVQHGLSLPDLEWYPNKWSNRDHIDLRQILTGFDDRKRGTQEQWARRLGYPAMLALEHQGNEIAALWNDGNLEAIAEKCESDVHRLIFLHNKLAPYIQP